MIRGGVSLAALAAVAVVAAASGAHASASPASDPCHDLPAKVAHECRIAAAQCQKLAPHGQTYVAQCLAGLAKAMDAIRAHRHGHAPAAKRQLTLLPASMCSRPYSGPGQPQLLIASELPLSGANRTVAIQMSEAIQLVLQQDGYKAGRYAVGYQSCDEASASPETYARDKDLVGLIGGFDSVRDEKLIPTLDRGAAGPIAVVGPQGGYIGLTHGGPGAAPGDPGTYYPRHVRNFVRVFPADDYQVAADALLAVNTLGASKVYVLDDGTPSGAGLATGMKNMLGALGATVVGSSSWDPSAPSYEALATTIQQSGAQAVFLGGSLTSNGAKLVRDLRSVLGTSAALIVPDTFEPATSLAAAAGLAANGVYLSAGGVPTSALGSPGQTFAAKFLALYHTDLDPAAARAAEAAVVLLGAIARSTGSDTSICAQLFATRILHGIVGNVVFDSAGDLETNPITVSVIAGGKETPFKVITPPSSLVNAAP